MQNKQADRKPLEYLPILRFILTQLLKQWCLLKFGKCMMKLVYPHKKFMSF